jgi:hypothetical protein
MAMPWLSATLPFVPLLSNEMAWTKWLGLLHHHQKELHPRRRTSSFVANDTR